MGNSVVGNISKNTLTDVKGNAIHITDSTAGHVDGNKISGKACTGGVFSARAKITSISGNGIKNVKGQGIYMSSNSVVSKVDKNTIKKTGKEGILLTSQSQVASVSKNKITNAGSYGIKLSGSKKKKVKIISNKLSGKKSATGIWVQAGKATVNKNTLTGFKLGIRTNKSMTGKLKGNKFKKCKKKIS
jgi:nitrous oxidase accessory protein NosD